MIFNGWKLAAGLTLFLFSMFIMEDSIKLLAGRPFKKFLQRQTRNKLRAIAGGALVTGFLQSSSVVLLMVLSFVGAGILTMRNALGIILGANFGTTIDSWVVATLGFKIPFSELAFPILSIALPGLILFSSNKKVSSLSKFLCGFALLFVGLDWMKESVSGLVDRVDLSDFAGMSAYIFLPVGFILTAVIQSSSAVMAISLTALNGHILQLDQAAAITIGSELGTSIKLLIGSVGGIPDKKRMAWANFIINLVTLVVCSILLYPILRGVTHLLPTEDPLIVLVAFQSAINLLSIVIFFPFLGRFATFLESFFRRPSDVPLTLYIHHSGKRFTDKSIELAEKETVHLLRQAIDLNRLTFNLDEEDKEEEARSFFRHLKRGPFSGLSFTDSYNRLKLLQGEILEYLVEIQHDDVQKQDIEKTGILITVCRNIIHAVKNIKDIRQNLQDLADTANDPLYEVFQKLRKSERNFYTEFEKIVSLKKPEGEDLFQRLHNVNKAHHQESIDSALRLLNRQQVNEFEVSTLLNVFREVYSSHKAFITALEDLYEAGKEG